MKNSHQDTVGKHRDLLFRFQEKNHRMPSFGEMMKLFGYKTKSAVSYAVEKLIAEGVIYKDRQGKIIPQNFGELKILGVVEAGFPTSAEEELIDTMSLDEYLVPNKESTYLLKVKGDSMIDAGILPGDLVVVERGKTPRPNDIVIAEIDEEYTMKYYRVKKGKAYLEPANKNYDPIYPENALSVVAVVQAVVRKYRE